MKTRASRREPHVCIADFAGEFPDGSSFQGRRGATVPGSHPAVKRWPEYFVPASATAGGLPVIELGSTAEASPDPSPGGDVLRATRDLTLLTTRGPWLVTAGDRVAKRDVQRILEERPELFESLDDAGASEIGGPVMGPGPALVGLAEGDALVVTHGASFWVPGGMWVLGAGDRVSPFNPWVTQALRDKPDLFRAIPAEEAVHDA